MTRCGFNNFIRTSRCETYTYQCIYLPVACTIIILSIAFCHGTTRSMIFNVDHVWNKHSPKEEKQGKQYHKTNVLASSRLLDYNSLLDYSSFNVDHSKTFPEEQKPRPTKTWSPPKIVPFYFQAVLSLEARCRLLHAPIPSFPAGS